MIARIVGEVGRHIDESSPMVDARLSDGSRVNAVFPPLAIGGPFLTIRKFETDPFTLEDLIDFGTLTPQVGELLHACVQGKANVMVSGGAGTGKTTMLNVLSSFIPPSERIITIEDAKELQLRQRHVLCLEYRPPNTEGTGEVTIRDLLRNSLRMRPDRIIIGECRSGEALDMLQAMNTGHDGSLTTVHANSPRDALTRVETMTLMSGFDLPVRAVREQMAAALDLIVHLSRMRDGSRRVTHVTEVGRMEGDMVLLQDIFVFDHRMGTDENGRPLGHLKATGLRPHITQRLGRQGCQGGPGHLRHRPRLSGRPSRHAAPPVQPTQPPVHPAEVTVRSVLSASTRRPSRALLRLARPQHHRYRAGLAMGLAAAGGGRLRRALGGEPVPPGRAWPPSLSLTSLTPRRGRSRAPAPCLTSPLLGTLAGQVQSPVRGHASGAGSTTCWSGPAHGSGWGSSSLFGPPQG